MAGVFDFDEDDIEPFPAKKTRTHVSRPVKDAEQKRCSTPCRKHRGKINSGKSVDEKIDTKGNSQSLGSVLKDLRCNLSHGSTMTQSFESSSKGDMIEQAVNMIEQPVNIQGCCGEVLNVSPYAKVKEEKLSEVTIEGEGLLFAEGTIQMHSVEFTFMTDSIALKLLDNQNLTTIALPLDEITGFSFRTCEQTSDNMLELNLTESGMKLLEQKLGSLLCKSDFSCDKAYTLTTKIRSPFPSDQEKTITSLCDHYKLLWRPGKRHDQMCLKQDLRDWKGSEKPNLLGEGESNERVFSKGLEGNMTAWFDLIYPKGDPDAVMVTIDDFLLLNPNEFVSDTIIDFYIKYLQTRLPEHEKKRLYFFNSFFFRKLAYLDRVIAYGLEKTSSLFEHMKRWTRDINIFMKDFLFIPIMQSSHWSLVIVCHPKHLFNDELQKCDNETSILHFDSMEGFHEGVEETIKKYLVQHWAHTFSTSTSRNDKPCNVKCISAKVPQQTNYSDCGLFMLHYVEMFLTALQSRLSTIQVSRNWFNPEDVASKRSMLQRLIKEIQEEETAGKVVLDAPLEKPMHGTVFMEDVAIMVLSEHFFVESDVGSSQKADSCCHSGLLHTVDHASHEPVCCHVAHAVCGNQLGKASDACWLGAAIKTFDEDNLKESSNRPLMENTHPTDLRAGKDRRQLINICGDLDVSREELNKTHRDSQSEGSVTNAKQAKNSEVDNMHVSFHTLKTTPEVDEDGDRSYSLMYCDQGATQGSKLKCLPCKEQHTLLRENNHGVSPRDLDFEDHYTFTGVSSKATHLGNLVDDTQDEEQGHSARVSPHHAHDPTCPSQQVNISSDEESGFVKVQKIVEAAKLRQQSRQKGVPTPIASNTSKRKENQPPNSKWRLRRKSQFHFL